MISKCISSDKGDISKQKIKGGNSDNPNLYKFEDINYYNKTRKRIMEI